MSYRDLKSYQTATIIYDFTVEFCDRHVDKTNQSYRSYLGSAEGAANAAICLINQANFLLDRQIKSLEEKFVESGGWNENIYNKRVQYREDVDKRFYNF
jgi:four helix bundle suffix protein